MGESHGVGAGPAGFGGAGCPAGRSPAAAGAAGFAAAGVAGFGGVAGAAAAGLEGVDMSEGGEGLVGVVVASDWTEPAGADFTPPGVAGLSAVDFSFSGGGVGDLVSSGIRRRRRTPAQAAFERTITFISLSE